MKAYKKKNVFFLHFLGGDEDVPLLHFKKHYRLSYPMIPDNCDRNRHIIRVTGISNVAVFGGDGICVYNEGSTGQRLKAFQKVIDKALAKIKGPNRKKNAFLENGTVYAPQVKKEKRIIHERMAQLAPGPEGEIHLVYVSDESGSNDIFLKTCAKGKWGETVPVAASSADEYAPVIVSTGKGSAFVAYVADKKDRYEIYAAEVKNGEVSSRQQVSRSSDDAMDPCICRDKQGNFWLAWYEWKKMGDYSRDREIFISHSKGKKWSRPVQVSPKNVKSYEDHAEPAVAPDGKGGCWVAWAWDYHSTLPQMVPVDENSIFLRHVNAKLKPGKLLAAGYRGEGRARDYVPSLVTTPDGTPWIAWDNSHKSSLGYGGKGIFLNHLSGKDFEEQVEAAASRGQIDSPTLLVHPRGGLILLWCQETSKGWEMWQRRVGKKMGKAKKISTRGKNPRYPAAAFDTNGRLWITYTSVGIPEWRVRVEAID